MKKIKSIEETQSHGSPSDEIKTFMPKDSQSIDGFGSQADIQKEIAQDRDQSGDLKVEEKNGEKSNDEKIPTSLSLPPN